MHYRLHSAKLKQALLCTHLHDSSYRFFVLAGSIELQTYVPPVLPEILVLFKYAPQIHGSGRSARGDAPEAFQGVFLWSSGQRH